MEFSPAELAARQQAVEGEAARVAAEELGALRRGVAARKAEELRKVEARRAELDARINAEAARITAIEEQVGARMGCVHGVRA